MPSEFNKRQKHDFFRDFTSLGSLWFYLIAVLYFFIVQNYALLKKLIIGLLAIYLIIIGIRTLYFKERPSRYPHKSYIERLDASSFPSLHATRIVFLGLVFVNYFNNNLASFLLVILIVIVIYSRIYLKKHDTVDVVFGSILGAVVYFIVNFLL